MTSTTGKIVNRYMSRLGEELRDIPRARREELMTEIRDHIEEAQDEQDAWDEAGIRNVLDQIGDPADIGAEARERFGTGQPGMGLREHAAVILLAIGGIVLPLIGWLIGLVLLWGSRAWTRREKWVGTLLVPGGLAAPFWLLTGGVGGYTCYGDGDTPEDCPGMPTELERTLLIAGLLFAVAATIFTAAYLARHARRGAEMAAY